jgi:type I restriction enzyme, S subunit
MRAYPEYKDSGVEWIGDIPSHWELSTLRYQANMIVPMRDKPKLFTGSIPWIRIEDFTGKYISGSKSEQKVTQTVVDEMNLKIFPVGTILCSCSCNMGATAIVSTPLISNQTFIGIVPSDSLDSDYMYYLIHAVKPTLDSMGTGAIQKYLSRHDFESLRLSFPPLPEQRIIADFLDRKTRQIDTLIEKKQRQVELLQEQRTAAINQAVTKGLNPDAPMKDSGIEWLGQVPAHWEVKKLKHISFVNFSNVDKHAIDGEHPVKLCNYTDVYYNDFITSELEFMNATATDNEIIKFTLRRGDVILTKDSESWDDIAIPASVINDMEGVLCGYHLAQVRPHREFCANNFLFWAFCTKEVNDQYKVSATGVTRYGLGKYALENSYIPLPPHPEQHAIADFLGRKTRQIDAQVEKKQLQVEQLQEYRTALISAAVTGKIDLREPQP